MAGVLQSILLRRPSIGIPARQFLSLELRVPSLLGIQCHQRQKGTAIELPYKKLTDISDAAIAQAGKGKIYDKKPFKYSLVKGKKYVWCCCGWSKSQPFCDGTHANPHMRIKLGPVIFKAPETGDYWLCNCKQTSQRPFCDGTHRNEEIQSAVKS